MESVEHKKALARVNSVYKSIRRFIISERPNMAATNVSLKLFIDKKSNQVLFAEADKKFVDFLFFIFKLPVGTVTRLLQEKNTAGSLNSLYESVKNLSDIYMQPDQDKDFLLNPKVATISGAIVPLLLPSVEQSYTAVKAEKFYKCGNHQKCTYVAVANDRRAICPSCSSSMNSELRYVDYPQTDIKASSSSEGGYVKGLITYMVTDDLDVKPISMSTDSGTLLSKFNVTDVGAVEEKMVDFGMDEVYIYSTHPFLYVH